MQQAGWMAVGLVGWLALPMVGCTATSAVPVGAATASPDGSLADRGGNPSLSGAFLFFEDFETGTPRWEFPNNTPVTWRLLKTPSCGGNYAMLFGAERQAPFTNQAADATLVLDVPIDLSKSRHPKLQFDVRGAASPANAITIQAEASASDGVWKPVGAPVQGDHALMATVGADLTPWAGKPIGLRFRATSQAVPAEGKGLLFDNVQVIDLGAL